MQGPPDLQALESTALDLAAVAAAETLAGFRADIASESKGRGAYDPVTAADRGAEAAIRQRIAERRPDDGVVGEEYGDDRPDADFVWVVDPIDGTRAYVAGLPLWTTLIALRWRGEPVLGVVAQPYLGETFVGSAAGARLIRAGQADLPLRARPCARLTDAVIATTDPDLFNGAELGAWRQVRATARLARLGCDAYAYAMVALGRLDLVVETGLKAWDVEAAVPLLEAAGGFVCDWRGGRIGRDGGQMALGGDRRCLEEALVALSRSAA